MCFIDLQVCCKEVKTIIISSFLHIVIGIPQGHVLGPVLFQLFVNYLPNCIARCACNVFVDDTILYAHISRSMLQSYHVCYEWLVKIRKPSMSVSVILFWTMKTASNIWWSIFQIRWRGMFVCQMYVKGLDVVFKYYGNWTGRRQCAISLQFTKPLCSPIITIVKLFGDMLASLNWNVFKTYKIKCLD